MQTPRQRDYTFKEFNITVGEVEYTVSVKVWYSFSVKDMGVMDEHLGQTLTDSKRECFEIEDIYIEKIESDYLEKIEADNYEEDLLLHIGRVLVDIWENQKLCDDIETLVKKDYTQYFSLD